MDPALKPREVDVTQKVDVAQKVDVTQEVEVINNWSSILQNLNLNGLALNAAEQTELIGKSGRVISLRISPRHSSVFTKAVITRIEQGLSNYYKEEIKLKLVNDDKIKFTPAQQKSEIQKKANDDAVLALQGDQFFQQLQQEFSAELVRDSIVPLKDDL